MAQPYVGEIRIFAGNFNPAGWEFCKGQLLPIAENETLYQVIGTTYGGDGESTFGLPDLRGRLPLHQTGSQPFTMGAAAGAEEVTLTIQQIPVHNHALLASSSPTADPNPQNNVLAEQTAISAYQSAAPASAMAQAIGPVGGSQPHTNFQPYLCLNFIISLYGIFPSPS